MKRTPRATRRGGPLLDAAHGATPESLATAQPMLVPFAGGDLLVITMPEATAAGLDGLTAAEWATAMAATRGLSNAEIAAELGIARNTVAGQLASVYRKLGIAGRSELATRLALLSTIERPTGRRAR